MRNSKLLSSQKGFVSIFTALMLMGILALLTLGFSYAVRQAQRRTLDDQLATQAFYAAESGINEAIEELSDPASPITSKSDCEGGPFSYDVDSSTNLSYSCLLIETQVNDYKNDNVPVAGLGEPVVIPLNTSAAPLTIEFEWDSATSNATAINPLAYVSGSPALPNAQSWDDGIGMLRVDLIPTDSIDNRQNMINNSYTQFLYPTSDNTYPANQTLGWLHGPTYHGGTTITRCGTVAGAEYRCKATMTIMRQGGLPINRTSYYLRLQAYYNPVKVKVTPKTATGQNVVLQRVQAIIDATGRAGDVYRRVQVRYPIYTIPGLHTPYALTTSDSICKRLVAAPPDASGAGGTYPSPPLEMATDSACGIN